MPKEEVIERSTPNDDDIPQTLVMETATDETIIPQTTDVPKTEVSFCSYLELFCHGLQKHVTLRLKSNRSKLR